MTESGPRTIVTIDPDFFHAGSCEGFKRGYHAAILVLVAGAAVYNAIAFARRREWHLAVNVVVDVAIAAIEARACRQHRRAG